MPDWNNWKWEIGSRKVHSSYRKKGMSKKEQKKNNVTNISTSTAKTTRHYTVSVNLNFLIIVALAMVFYFFELDLFFSILFALLFGLWFGTKIGKHDE